MAAFLLTPEQNRIIALRNKHLQVIACAGSGKTESISRRVASLIAEGELPESIIAFTFTEKAAAELKDRIYQRVEEVKGKEFLGRLGPMFVGTIHGYSFRLLQTHVPHYGNYDILDEHRHYGFLSREYQNLKLGKLGNQHWQPIRDFAKSADVISNELIPVEKLRGTALGECYEAYLEALDRYHFLTFGLVIARTVEVLSDKGIFSKVHTPLRHLVVDEYQDINPAQEKLIELLSTAPVQLCVVGDDDQSIYEWRGSDIENILHFAKRRRNVETIKLETNRRSRPEIVKQANHFAGTIPDRLAKKMAPSRSNAQVQVVTWAAESEAEEVEQVADTINELHVQGFRYQDIAVLYRSVRTSAPALLKALAEREIPYSCAGRTGLFMQPEINAFGEIYAWLVGGQWRDETFGQFRDADLANISKELSSHFNNAQAIPGLEKYLIDWRTVMLRGNRATSLVGDFYRLLEFLHAEQIDIDTAAGSARFGAFARFSQVLADFEHVTRRGRYVEESGKRTFKGGRDRGKPYLQHLHNYMLHYARDAYEDFAGEANVELDAVDIMTVHQAKGLEWPVVFMPGLTSRRFPTSKAGQEQPWLFSQDVFPDSLRRRYEGGDSQERRLFYVALTRARDAVYLSFFKKINQKQKPSPYLLDIAGNDEHIHSLRDLPVAGSQAAMGEVKPPSLELSFTDIANFEDCAFRYRLSRLLGFQIEIAVELGYGKAIHHVLRQIAETARSKKIIPDKNEIKKILQEEFYLPFADHPTFERMYQAAEMLVNNYLRKYSTDLYRVWDIERPFEVHIANSTLAGRADLILDKASGKIGQLAIVEYKTATDPMRDERYQLQLAVYAAAGRGEGLNVTASYLHELKDGMRRNVDISTEVTSAALESIANSILKIRQGKFNPKPQADLCRKCDYRRVCKTTAYREQEANLGDITDEKKPAHVQGKIMKQLLKQASK